MSSSSKVIFTNAKLVGHPAEETYHVVVKDGFVDAISRVSVDTEHAKVVDLAKSWLAPSLVDHHTHFKWWAVASRRLDLHSALSAQKVIDMVREALSSPRFDPAKDPLLVGQHMRVGVWPDLEKMCRQTLDDELSKERPIFLVFAGFHSMCMNSAALKHVGIDAEGHSGILEEKPAFEAQARLFEMSDEIMDPWIAEAAQAAASLGVTEVVDLEMEHNIKNWSRRVREQNFRTLRVHCGMYDAHLDDAISRGLRSGDVVPNTGSLVYVGPYKIITDGSLGSRTAYCHEPYPGTNNYGMWAYEEKTLKAMSEHAVTNGFRLAVHAIGDKAIHLTLKSLASMKTPPLPGSTIEHAQLLSFEDIDLFRDLGLAASIQPVHMIDDKELCEKFWPSREHRAFAFASMAKAGIPLKLGSDCPVAPLQPWEAMAVAISRTTPGGATVPGWHEEQKLSNLEAWVGSTSNGRADLQIGDRADLCVLGANPLTADAIGLRSMHVKGTMLGGRWTHVVQGML